MIYSAAYHEVRRLRLLAAGSHVLSRAGAEAWLWRQKKENLNKTYKKACLVVSGKLFPVPA